MRVFGLIGHRLEYSFSERYFNDRIRRERVADAIYRNFPIGDIGLLPQLLQENPDIVGLNVTSPYKESVITYLDGLSPEAERIGAVNCVLRRSDGLYGYNTDCFGFRNSVEKFLHDAATAHAGASMAAEALTSSEATSASASPKAIAASGTLKLSRESGVSIISVPSKAATMSQSLDAAGVSGALILGSGGAAKAVRYVLDEISIPSKTVTSRLTGTVSLRRTEDARPSIPKVDTLRRTWTGNLCLPKSGSLNCAEAACLRYSELTPAMVSSHRLIINATPLGMYPQEHTAPPFPYELLTPRHYLYDLVYNPPLTAFLQKGVDAGASVMNGYEMLILQAEKSWELFGL